MSGVLGPRAAWTLAVGCLVLFLPVRIGAFMTGIFGGGPPPDSGTLAVGTTIIVVIFVLHGSIVWARMSAPLRRLAMAALALLTFGPYVLLGPSWAPIGGLLGAAVLLTSSGRRAWLTFAAVVASDVALAAAVLPPIPLPILAFRSQSTFILGLLLFAVARLAQLVRQLHDAREELAATEVARYRVEAAVGLRAAIGERLATILVTARGLVDAGDVATRQRTAARIAATSREAMAAVREVADVHRTAGRQDHPGGRPATRDLATPPDGGDDAWVLGRRIVVVAVLSFSGTFLNNLWADGIVDPTRWLVAIVACIVASWLHVHHASPRAGGAVPDGWRLTLALQILLSVAAMAYFGMNANPLPVMAIGAVLARVRPPWSVVVAVGGTLAMTVAGQPAVDQLGWHLYRVAITLGSAIAFYALYRFPDVARELHVTRRGVAAVAVARDRHRVARDVHDLLGYSLAAIGLRAELLGRRLARGEGVEGEGEELTTLAEQALADLRSITIGPPALNLTGEVAAAEALLAAVGIERRISVDHAALPPATEAALATVLREAVTNVARHVAARSTTTDLRIEDATARLAIRNDGAGAGADDGVAPRRRGTGIANLTARVEAVGGALTVTATGDGTFTITAVVPTGRRPATPAPVGATFDGIGEAPALS